MQRFSRRIPGKDPILDEERIAAARYLSSILGEKDDDDDDEEEQEDGNDRGRRGRRG